MSLWRQLLFLAGISSSDFPVLPKKIYILYSLTQKIIGTAFQLAVFCHPFVSRLQLISGWYFGSSFISPFLKVAIKKASKIQEKRSLLPFYYFLFWFSYVCTSTRNTKAKKLGGRCGNSSSSSKFRDNEESFKHANKFTFFFGEAREGSWVKALLISWCFSPEGRHPNLKFFFLIKNAFANKFFSLF